MSRYNYHNSAFRNGMISPKLHGRTDIDEYTYSVKDLKNFLPAPMGGVFSRPGTVNQACITDQGCIIPWERSDGNYFIVFKKKTFTSFSDCFLVIMPDNKIGGVQLSTEAILRRDGSGAATHSQVVLYQTNSGASFASLDYYGFTYVTVENSLIICHNSGLIPPLLFYVNTAGTVVYADHFQFTKMISVPINGSSSSNGYYSTEIARGWESTPYLINKENIYLLPSVAPAAGQEGQFTSTHITCTLTAYDGNTVTTKTYFTSDMQYTYVVLNQNDKEGVYFITGIVGASPSTQANAVIICQANDNTTKSRNFRRQLFAPDLGFPKLISTFNGRVIFANTDEKPNWFWCSRTNRHRDIVGFRLFQRLSSEPITDIDSFELPLSSRDYSEIKWISQQDNLLVGTGKEEFVLKQGEGALSIKNIGISPQSNIGGSFVPAIKNSESVFFVSADGKSIRQAQYNFDVNGYRSKNISILNDDIIYKLRSGQTVSSLASIKIIKLAWQESNRTLWVLTNSGNLFSVTIEPNSTTTAWAYHHIGNMDSVVDIFTFFSQTLNRSVLGLVVNRASNYFIDIMTPEYLNNDLEVNSLDIADQPVFVDGAYLMKTPTNTVTFSGVFLIAAAGYMMPPNNFDYGLLQRFPTGKKFKVTAVDVPNGPFVVNGYVYIINQYQGYGFPYFKIATSLANALAGTFYTPTSDCQVTFEDAEPTATYSKWGSFVKYANQVVDVIADGTLVEGLTISSAGILTLPSPVSKIVVGFYYEGKLETITPDIGGQFGSSQGSVKRADRAYVRYYRSRTGSIGTKESNLEPIVFPEIPYTGAIDHYIDSSTDREYSLILKKEKSLPMGIMSITLRGKTDE